jgi:O-antigen/teichoic acid export membrane protein
MRQASIQLLKNTAVIYAVEIVARVLGLVFTIYAARVMGVKGFGDFCYALAVFAIVAVISDLGSSNLLVKVSAQNATVDKDFWAFTILRIVVTAATLVLVTLYLHFSHAERDVFYFSLLVGGGMVVGCYGQNLGYVFRGRNLMYIDGLIRISQSFFSAFLGIFALKFGLGLTGVGGAYFIAYVLSSVVALGTTRRIDLVGAFPAIVPKHYLAVIMKSAPFLIWMLLSVVYAKIDTILLLHLKGADEVGLYSAAGRVIDAIMIIPAGIYMGILPILSSLIAERNTNAIESLSRLTIKYMTYIGLFIACYIFFSADKVIEILYVSGQYKEAAEPLRILTLSTVASFFYMVLVALSVSGPFPQITALLSTVTLALLVVTDIMVIPRWGVTGASAGRLFVEFVSMIILITYVNKYIVKISYADFPKAAFIATFVLGSFMSVAKSLLFLPLYFLVYASTLYFAKGISKEEFTKIKELILLGLK